MDHIKSDFFGVSLEVTQNDPKVAKHDSFLGSAKTDPSGLNGVFGEGVLKDKLAFFEAFLKILYLIGANCLQNAHFYKQKGPCLKRPFDWTGSVSPLLILV